MKKKWIIISICIVLVSILGINVLKKDTVTLIINNTTNEDIDYLKLNYTGLGNDIDIPTIKANDKINFKVNIDNNFREGCMKIYYIHKNKKIEFVIIGYFEKGYKGKVNVNISVENGTIQITSD